MSQPISVDIPHGLGLEGIRARLEKGVGKIAGMIPGGADIEHRWEGNTMHFTVRAMGQTVKSTAEVFEDRVHAIVDLPPLLALFANKIRAKLEKDGPKLLK